MEGIYNPLKLSEHRALFGPLRVAVVGVGAVGTYLVEFLAKLGVGSLTLIDFDTFTAENAAKHSGLIRTPEDVGRNKAAATAQRAQVLMIPGGRAHGIAADLTRFGPMAFARFDAVFLALDNYAAKIYFNELWRSIPPASRPLLFVGGTVGEVAQGNCIDGTELCYRCLVDEVWLEHATVRTSCSGPQTRIVDGAPVPVRTSNRASCKAALLMIDAYDAFVRGDRSVCNKRFCYAPAFEPNYTVTTPLRRAGCPDCHGIHPPERVAPLPGSVLTLTLGALLEQVSARLGTQDCEVYTHILQFGGIAYGGVILDAYCGHCGAHLPRVAAHEGRTYASDLRCADCAAHGRPVRFDPLRPTGQVVHGFAPTDCPAGLRDKTLFALGWPLGAYIYGATRAEPVRDLCLTCADDPAVMDTVTTLA